MAARLSPTELSIRKHLRIGIALVALLAGGVGGWAATAEISGAVIAPGLVVVDSNVKQIQHPTGGVVDEILVRNGDVVKKGDLLIRLNRTILAANYAVVAKQFLELSVRKARLAAERDGRTAIELPEVAASRSDEAEVAEIIHGEQQLFKRRREARIGQKEQLGERVRQLAGEVKGLTAQLSANSRQAELVANELRKARDLAKDNLMPLAKLSAIEKEAARLEGELGQLTAAIAQAQGRTSETELQIIQIDKELASEVAREMREIELKLGELGERKIAAEDQLARVEIRSPQDGFVHQSSVHTVGGVIPAGDSIMLIVPRADRLTIEARVSPTDIDQISMGQQAMMRFSAFNQRTTPEIAGKVELISADIATDERTGISYYIARITVAPDEVARLGNVTLIPGMPVDVFINTGARTVASYITKPITDNWEYVFRNE